MRSPALEAYVATGLHLVQGYLLAGVAFGLLFVTFGVQRVDPEARHWPNLGFRLLLLPGLSVFWPLFAVRWWRGSPPPRERTAHRAIVKP